MPSCYYRRSLLDMVGQASVPVLLPLAEVRGLSLAATVDDMSLTVEGRSCMLAGVLCAGSMSGARLLPATS